jgi:transcriptional regulator with XRE-family HTH domain
MARGSATARVGRRVAELRAARGLSQDALATKARINRVTIARLEAALHPPNVETLDMIARALGVSLADLVK